MRRVILLLEEDTRPTAQIDVLLSSVEAAVRQIDMPTSVQ